MSLSATTRNNCCICSWDRAPLASGVKSSFGFSGLGGSAVVVAGEGEALSTEYPAGAEVGSGLCVAGAEDVWSSWPRMATSPTNKRRNSSARFNLRITYLTCLEGGEFPQVAALLRLCFLQSCGAEDSCCAGFLLIFADSH